MAQNLHAALAHLLDYENGGPNTGDYVALRAFIEPGRGDLYIEAVDNDVHRIVSHPESGVVMRTEDGWDGDHAAMTTYSHREFDDKVPETRAAIIEYFADSPGAEEVGATISVSDKGDAQITLAQGTLVLHADGTYTTIPRIEHF